MNGIRDDNKNGSWKIEDKINDWDANIEFKWSQICIIYGLLVIGINCENKLWRRYCGMAECTQMLFDGTAETL